MAGPIEQRVSRWSMECRESCQTSVRTVALILLADLDRARDTHSNRRRQPRFDLFRDPKVPELHEDLGICSVGDRGVQRPDRDAGTLERDRWHRRNILDR
ncbi:MAG TPA: hypothetical protein VNO55_26835 [Polyangia bacterium]|nr:hypothetical protein [Polyangia bacterium]